MSTQAVSNSFFQELQSFYQSRSADVKQLGSALQAGNLKKAEQVYSALVALGQNGPFSNSEAFASSGRANVFEAVGQALQAGDLAGAQGAFAKLQQAPSQHQGDLLNAAFVVTITSTQNQPVEQDKSGFWHQPNSTSINWELRCSRETLLPRTKAYDALVALGQSGPLRNGATFHRADRAADFATIGQALQSGDLAGAQQAFAALEDSFKPQTTALLGPLTPAPVQLPLGPPTPAPVPSAIPPQGTLPPGPPTPVPIPSTLPPHALPPGPPTFVSPPSTTGGGPSGPPEIIGNNRVSLQA